MTCPHRTLLLLLASLLVGCREKRVPTQASFYFWRTRLELSPPERKALSALQVKRLRVRLFDVARDRSGIHPVGKLQIPTGGAFPVAEVLPVVFLREAVFRGAPDAAGLAGRILSERDRICQEGKLPCKGLELDCDWTPGSKDGFFALCKDLGDILHARGQTLRSTLRLHQYRNPVQTGVPPVDRLTLMAYNMGPTTPSPERQSILDLKELSRWLDTRSVYPKPLDIALPLYSWALVVRNGHPVDLLQRIARRELDTLQAVAPDGNGLWKAQRSFFLHGLWVRQDDVLKLESPSRSALESATRILASKVPPVRDRELLFFDLSPSSLAAHPIPELESLVKEQ